MEETGEDGGDPLSLVFLVQAAAVTGKLTGMPDTYVDGFAGSFGMFNLQVRHLAQSMMPARCALSM